MPVHVVTIVLFDISPHPISYLCCSKLLYASKHASYTHFYTFYTFYVCIIHSFISHPEKYQTQVSITFLSSIMIVVINYVSVLAVSSGSWKWSQVMCRPLSWYRKQL